MSAVTSAFLITFDALPSAVLLQQADQLAGTAAAKRLAILRHRETLVTAMRLDNFNVGSLLHAEFRELPDAIIDSLDRVTSLDLRCRLRQLLRRIDAYHELLLDVSHLRQDAADLEESCHVRSRT